ncbi:NAD(P)-dependent alcohol dehydrogenase [Streptomyces sp. NPDC001941]|uniref:NAD(P)-dependent alcohol dehydrogenase n=1 Tax=Streptomyces sp. NPDC001941 TaxID=3154659 RepID=UPI00332B1AA8
MKALRYHSVGAAPEVVEVPDPTPGPGQILLKVAAAGACHSDLSLMSRPAAALAYPLPLTLGHEGVGTIEELGSGVGAFRVGEAVAVYGPWGCGRCRPCLRGEENYCVRAESLGIRPPGFGSPGTMAEYMIIDSSRHLVRLGDLDPVSAVSLTDAGLTPYHAIKRSLPKLNPGATAVVIGSGGLGHVAIQLLRALTAARVVALDICEDKLALARTVGAHEVFRSEAGMLKKVMELTDGHGAEAVFDFVGVQSTVETAGALVALDGDVMIVGMGGGVLPVGFRKPKYGVRVTAPYWGSRGELIEVLDLARAGLVRVHTETFPLEQAPRAYERLGAGHIDGRAVVLPH